MDRRSFLLAGAGALALAGCVERGPDGRAGANRSATRARTTGESTTERPLTRTAQSVEAMDTTVNGDDWANASTTETATTTSTPVKPSNEAVQRRVSLVRADDAEREHDLRIEVEVLEGTITASHTATSHTARVRVTTTNEGERRGISIGTEGCDLFNRDGGASTPPGLYLHSPGSTKWIDRPGDRWTDGTDPDEPRAVAAYGCGTPVYAEDESVTNEYAVWDDYQVEGYLTTGTYRFEEPVRVLPPGGSITSSDEQEPIAEFDWGFDLTVTNPENG